VNDLLMNVPVSNPVHPNKQTWKNMDNTKIIEETFAGTKSYCISLPAGFTQFKGG